MPLESAISISGIRQRAIVDMALSSTSFTDTQWAYLADKSVRRLNRKLRTEGENSQLSISGVDSSGVIVRSDSGSISDSLADIVLLQVECLVAKNIRRSSVGKGIKVRDGDSEIDTTASFGGHNMVVSDACSELDSAIKEFLSNDPESTSDASTYGALITYDNSNIIVDADHNGDSGGTRDYSSPFDSSTGPHDDC